MLLVVLARIDDGTIAGTAYQQKKKEYKKLIHGQIINIA
jgi:hypothetical protein